MQGPCNSVRTARKFFAEWPIFIVEVGDDCSQISLFGVSGFAKFRSPLTNQV